MVKQKQTLQEYIDSKMKERGIESYRKLSYLSDVSNSEISRILSKERQHPNPKILEKLSAALGASYEEMLDIVGYLSKNRIDTMNLPENMNPIDNMVLLPVLGVIRAGEPLYAQENVVGYEPVNPDFLRSGEYFFLKVVGDSMKNCGISNGSFVLVRKQETVENGEVGIVMVDEENATVKRVYVNGDYVILQSDNPAFPPKTFPIEGVSVIGKVVRAIIDPNERK